MTSVDTTASATPNNSYHPDSFDTRPKHPKGSKARILFSSVFGPYAQDDEYGSRSINPMELYHNQVTRVQGPFSMRMFHRSWGLMLLQENISAASTLLDFPRLKDFIHEIKTQAYDVVGITSIMPNILKVKKMCELIRAHLPNAKILVGGHLANYPDLEEEIDADHIVLGEGVQWMRHYVGDDEDAPIKHPNITSAFGTRIMGLTLPERRGSVAATLIPSVGCPLGCNFCSTSAMFGGRGKSFHFFKTGDELFEVMCNLEREMGVHSFFCMDENFLLHKKRALRLLELMEEHDKSWELYVFSSGKVLTSYTIEQLIGLGLSWVWMGLEGDDSKYAKLNGIDTKQLVKTMQENGIRVLGSTIIGMEEHTPDNIDEAIDYAVQHDTEFHQFMLYTPLPGTPLHDEHMEMGTLLSYDQMPLADIHGQYKFNYRHPNIPEGLETQILLNAFQQDIDTNGPSITRIVRTELQGWLRHKDNPVERIRRRYARAKLSLSTVYAGLLWATAKWYRSDPVVLAKITETQRNLYEEFGLKARISAQVIGRYIYILLKREDKRLKNGWTYEPPMFRETRPATAV